MDAPPPPRRDPPPAAPEAETPKPASETKEEAKDHANKPAIQHPKSFWGLPSIKFWESSAHARGKSAQQKEEQLRAEAEKEQAKPPRFEPVWVRGVEPKKRSGEPGLAAFLTWIAHQGYQVENHAVLTADGYILNVQRIHSSYLEDLRTTTEPPKPKPAVFLQHGLMDCAATWVINGRKSIGFGLADRGYDVWLGNSRGNRFSVQHRDYRRSQTEFWAFDWDHMAKYDLPACFEYIQTVTKRPKITYIGHSQGTTVLFAAIAINPALQEKLNLFIAFCPVAYVKHQYSKMLTYMTTMKTDAILDAFGVKSFNTPALFNSIFPGITRFTPDAINTGMVRMLMNAIVGFQEDNFDAQVMRDWLTFMPGGTSVRNILHWSQASRHGNFTAYDYGKEDKNMKAYGTKMPPEYDPASLTIPVVVFAGGADKLVHPNDLHRLMLKLSNVILVVEDEKYGHLDFLWGKNAQDKYHNVLYEVLAARNELPFAVHQPAVPLTAQSKVEPPPPLTQLDAAESKREKHRKKGKHNRQIMKSRSETDVLALSASGGHDSESDKRREREEAAKLIHTLETEEKDPKKASQHHRHHSNAHVLMQEIRRLRAENAALVSKYTRLEHATLSILNNMLEKSSPLYEEAFAAAKKGIPELKEAQIRAVILQEM